MNKSVKLYMIQDLVLLTVLGVLLEGISQRFASTILSGTPTIAFALLITFVAVARWNLWGLLVVPFLSLSTMIGGMNGELARYSDFYSWQALISETIGLLTVGLNVIFFRKHKTKSFMSTAWKVVLMILVDYIIYNAVQLMLYNVITSGNPFYMGELTKVYTVPVKHTDPVTEEVVWTNENKVVNLCLYAQFGFAYNVFGLVVAYIGVFILRSQGVVNNAIDKLIDDKRLAEAEYEYLNGLGNGKSGIDSVEAQSNEESADKVDDSKEN